MATAAYFMINKNNIIIIIRRFLQFLLNVIGGDADVEDQAH